MIRNKVKFILLALLISIAIILLIVLIITNIDVKLNYSGGITSTACSAINGNMISTLPRNDSETNIACSNTEEDIGYIKDVSCGCICCIEKGKKISILNFFIYKIRQYFSYY